MKSIALSIIPRPDFLACFYEKNCEYSVRSRYNMLLQEELVGWGSSTSLLSVGKSTHYFHIFI